MDLVQRSKEELVDILNEIQTSKRYGAKHTHTQTHTDLPLTIVSSIG